MHDLSASAIMYADDLVLLAPSISELQNMVRICSEELSLIDLKLNTKKSVCLRIGKRFKKVCCHINAGTSIIEWATEVKYLGIYIKSNSKFSCDVNKSKIKYYRAANAILGKLGHQDNAAASLHLLGSIALPVLTYSIEALSLNQTQLVELDHPWLRSNMKIFGTYDLNITKQCQLYAGVLPIPYYYAIQYMRFLSKIKNCDNSLLQMISSVHADNNVARLAQRYNCNVDLFTKDYEIIIRTEFKAIAMAGG